MGLRKEDQPPKDSIDTIRRRSYSLENKTTQEKIEAVFYLDTDRALTDPTVDIPEETRKLARQAYNDIFRPENEGFLGVEFIRDPHGPMMRAVMKPGTNDSVMIAVAFNKENVEISTWLNQALPEPTLKTGIKALADTAAVLNNVLKKKTYTVLHRSDWPPTK